ncbi:hypothetical protein D3C84_583180 [compost metagenome]
MPASRVAVSRWSPTRCATSPHAPPRPPRKSARWSAISASRARRWWRISRNRPASWTRPPGRSRRPADSCTASPSWPWMWKIRWRRSAPARRAITSAWLACSSPSSNCAAMCGPARPRPVSWARPPDNWSARRKPSANSSPQWAWTITTSASMTSPARAPRASPASSRRTSRPAGSASTTCSTVTISRSPAASRPSTRPASTVMPIRSCRRCRSRCWRATKGWCSPSSAPRKAMCRPTTTPSTTRPAATARATRRRAAASACSTTAPACAAAAISSACCCKPTCAIPAN